MSNLIKIADPIKASFQNLLVITFAKTRSPNYSVALKVAQNCAGYSEYDLDGTPLNFVAIGPNPEDVARAILLMQYISGWSSTQLFCKGKLIKNNYAIMSVLDCYLESAKCTDSKAHCFGVIDDPAVRRPRTVSLTIRLTADPNEEPEKEIDKYIIPCKFLGHYGTTLSADHPSSYRDQVQALGVQKNCDICPNFNPDNFRKVEKKYWEEHAKK